MRKMGSQEYGKWANTKKQKREEGRRIDEEEHIVEARSLNERLLEA